MILEVGSTAVLRVKDVNGNVVDVNVEVRHHGVELSVEQYATFALDAFEGLKFILDTESGEPEITPIPTNDEWITG